MFLQRWYRLAFVQSLRIEIRQIQFQIFLKSAFVRFFNVFDLVKTYIEELEALTIGLLLDNSRKSKSS